jgi:hypothetical protein
MLSAQRANLLLNEGGALPDISASFKCVYSSSHMYSHTSGTANHF